MDIKSDGLAQENPHIKARNKRTILLLFLVKQRHHLQPKTFSESWGKKPKAMNDAGFLFNLPTAPRIVGFLRGGVQGEGVFLGNPKDSGREDWGSP